MISLSHTRYGSGVSPLPERHGKLRRSRPYQARSDEAMRPASGFAFLFCMTGTPAARGPKPWCKLVGIEASGGRGPSTVDFQAMDERERRSLARAAAAARPIGAFSAQALDPAARARGFATAALLADWPAIVGAELARFTMPDRVVWPRHRDNDGENVRLQRRREDG